MHSIPIIQHAWELSKAGITPDEIAIKLGKHRATIYRWLAGIRLKGIQKFLRDYHYAKKGHRHRKTDPLVKSRIYSIREEFKHCCGEKIQYWYHQRFGSSIGLTTIYRILNEKYILRSKYKKNQPRGFVPKAERPRQVIQTDTVDFGELFAYTAVDIYTREAWVVIKDRLNSEAGAEALKEQFLFFNQTELLQRDGGSEFELHWEQVAKYYCKTIRTSRPYKKNEQAYIESFNRTLRKECLGWYKYRKQDIYRVRAKVLQFLDFYNNRRPHLSLNLATQPRWEDEVALSFAYLGALLHAENSEQDLPDFSRVKFNTHSAAKHGLNGKLFDPEWGLLPAKDAVCVTLSNAMSGLKKAGMSEGLAFIEKYLVPRLNNGNPSEQLAEVLNNATKPTDTHMLWALNKTGMLHG